MGPGKPPARLISRTPFATRRPRFARGARRVHPRVRGDGGGDARGTPGEYEVTFETEGEDDREDERDGTRPRRRARTFLVSQALGEDLAPLVTAGREKYGMKLVPWAAVAAELTPANDDGDAAEKNDGVAFFFCPSRRERVSPVHVNAYFELSSNRRDIWFGEDMAGGGAARSEWNQALLERVVAPACARLISAAKTRLGPSREYYGLLPRVTPPAPWGAVVARTCALLRDAPVLHTQRTAGDGSPRPRRTYPDHETTSDPTLARALVDEGTPIPDAPSAVLERMEEHAVSRPERVSPNGVRRALRAAGRASAETARAIAR